MIHFTRLHYAEHQSKEELVAPSISGPSTKECIIQMRKQVFWHHFIFTGTAQRGGSRNWKKCRLSLPAGLEDFSNRIQSDYHSWCVAGYPSVEWVNCLSGQRPGWSCGVASGSYIIYGPCRSGWSCESIRETLDATLHEKVDYLNDRKYMRWLRYEARAQTSQWHCQKDIFGPVLRASMKTAGNSWANMPTEERSGVPEKTGKWHVSNTLPLSYGGNLIDGFISLLSKMAKSWTLKLSKVMKCWKPARYRWRFKVSWGSRTGAWWSPISNTGKLFYNTLFDENASCHIALGSACAFASKAATDVTGRAGRSRAQWLHCPRRL